MTEISARTVLAVVLAVAIALTGAAAPVAAGHGGDHSDNGQDDEHRNDDGRHDEADSDNSSIDIEIHQHGPVGGFLDIYCTGTLLQHGCDKEGSFHGGPVTVDYHGNNSADYVNGTSGGGDTFVVTAGNQSGSASFDCTFTQATVTNQTACEAGGTPPGNGTGGAPV